MFERVEIIGNEANKEEWLWLDVCQTYNVTNALARFG